MFLILILGFMNLNYYITIFSILFLTSEIQATTSDMCSRENYEQVMNNDQQVQNCRAILAGYASNDASVLEQFDQFADGLQKYYIEKDAIHHLQPILKAVAFAAEKHVGQFRQNAAHTPYIIHPIGVAKSLWHEANVRSTNVLVAALLHDTLEDTATTAEEIEQHFGPRIRYTVEELTDPSELSKQERLQRQVDHAPLMSLNAQLVKLADRLYNIRDMRVTPVGWSEEKVNNYREWGTKLLQALQGTNEQLEKALEEEIQSQLSNRPPTIVGPCQ